MSRPRPSTGCPRSSTVTGTPASASASAAKSPAGPRPTITTLSSSAAHSARSASEGDSESKSSVGSSSQSRLTRSSFFGLGRMSSFFMDPPATVALSTQTSSTSRTYEKPTSLILRASHDFRTTRTP